MLITKLLNVVSQTTGLQCHYGSRERLNDEMDDATFPCAFVFLMQNGNIQTDGGQICESSNVGVFVVDKTDYDFETIENAEIIEQCKQRIDRLIFGLYGSDSLQLNQINNTTKIYDEFDVILTGYAVEINVTEIYGTACVGAVIPEPHPYALQDKTVTPSSIQQIITADSGYYGLGHVTVEPGQTCELQEKEIEVVENGQSEITPDEGYNGISKLTLTTNVPLPTIEPQKEIDINQNGDFTIDPSTNFDAMSKVVAHVDVPQTRVQALRAFQINKDNVSLLPVRIDPSSNYDAMAEVAVDVVVNPVTVEATTQMQSVTPHEYGLAFFDGVTINPVTRYIDSNIQPQNIKKDITILGVTGTFEGGGNKTTICSAASLFLNFQHVTGLTEIWVGNLDTKYVTNFSSCFQDNWGGSNVTIIHGLEEWNTQSAIAFNGFFTYMNHLEFVDLTSFDFTNVTNVTSFFFRNNLLKTIIGSHTILEAENGLKVFDQLKVSLSISESSLLRYSSMLALANGVKDLSGATAQTITFNSTAWGNVRNDDDTIPDATTIAERQANLTTIFNGKNWTIAH